MKWKGKASVKKACETAEFKVKPQALKKKSALVRILDAVTRQDYLFSIVSKLTGVFIALVYSVIYNRYLGASLKGEAAIIANYAALLSSFLCFGMYQAYPFYRRKNPDEFYPFVNTTTSFFFVTLAGSILFFVAAPGVDLNFRFAIVLTPFLSYIRHINYVVTIENPRLRNIASILIALTDLGVVAFMWCCTEATYAYLALILLVQTIINLAFSYVNLKTKLKYFRFTLSKIGTYAKFGFLPMLTLFLMTVNYRIDIVMLEQCSTVNLAQIGIYSVGVALAEKVWLVPDAVKDILLSKLCKQKESGGDEVAKVIRLNVLVSLAMIVVLGLLSAPLVRFVYGEEYRGADIITVIILCGSIGMVFYKMVYSFNISRGKRGINLSFLAIAAGLNIVGNYYLIPISGIYGAALTSVVSYTVCGVCFLAYFHKVSNISYKKILFLQKEDIAMIRNFLRK